VYPSGTQFRLQSLVHNFRIACPATLSQHFRQKNPNTLPAGAIALQLRRIATITHRLGDRFLLCHYLDQALLLNDLVAPFPVLNISTNTSLPCLPLIFPSPSARRNFPSSSAEIGESAGAQSASLELAQHSDLIQFAAARGSPETPRRARNSPLANRSKLVAEASVKDNPYCAIKRWRRASAARRESADAFDKFVTDN